MSTSSPLCLIIGASHAGANLATAVRKEGWEGRILVIGDETVMPYHRPPLSKALLLGEKTAEQIEIFKPTVYEKANIEFLLGVTAERIDRSTKTVHLSNGDALVYDKLSLCTGARARKLDIPGANLKGIYYLRTMQDAHAIQAQIKAGNKAVIIGGGYIGLETAASLRKHGMEVTVLEMMHRILERVTAPEMSAYYQDLHDRHGVNILVNAQVQELRGTDHVQQVVCKDGQVLDADLVIVGIGVIPNTELAAAAGLATDNGVVVDEHAQTEDPDIVAVGDCTNHPNGLLGYRLRLESVPNAMDQAKAAAASICGQKKPYHSLPWFWSDQYNAKLQIAGFNRGYERVVVRGVPSSDQFVGWYLKGNQVLAADCINSPKEFMAAKKLIAQQITVKDSDLADSSLDLNSLIPVA